MAQTKKTQAEERFMKRRKICVRFACETALICSEQQKSEGAREWNSQSACAWIAPSCQQLIWKERGSKSALNGLSPASLVDPGLALRDVRSTTSITEHQTDRYRRLLIKRTRLLASRDSCDNKQALRSAATAASNKDGCSRIITSPAHAHPCTPARCLVADPGL
jgi:hypothetical protein